LVPPTHLVNNKPTPVYVNVDQIWWIGDPVGAAADYKTRIMLSQGSVDVRETVADVMRLINPPSADATAQA
jgi:hypothetical protein